MFLDGNLPIIKKISKNHSGLFANRSYGDGSIVLFLSGHYVLEPTRTSIQIKDRHLENIEGGNVNHHCNPNTKIVIFSSSFPSLLAIKNIETGEEITFDYETTESKLAYPFKCNCHKKWIKGFSTPPSTP